MVEAPVNLLPHPLPHPPPAALLALPFGLVSYPTAAVVWFLFEAVCLGVSAFLLVRWLFQRPRALHYLGAGILLLLWSPVKDELAVGQLMSVLLLLLTVSWLLLRQGRDLAGGILLGLVLALKLVAWPVALFLLFQRRWKALFAAGGAFLAANLLGGLLIGFDRTVDYYLKVAGSVSLLYRAHERNFSIWTTGYRLFEGMGSSAGASVSSDPLVSAPGLAPFVSVGLALLLLAGSLYLALRSRSFDASLAIVICTSIVINPVAWSHYLLLALIPAAVILKSWTSGELPPGRKPWAVAALLLLFLATGIRSLMLVVSGESINPTGLVTVSWAASLFSLSPLVAVLMTIAVFSPVDSLSSAGTAASTRSAATTVQQQT
jgi:hypothetical protein